MGMLVHINGAPGVGKLTIARIIAQRFDARVLDNHAIYNVGFALTDFRSAAFYDAVRSVRAVAYDQILRLPENEAVILTAADFDDSEWGQENWRAVERLADDRRWPFFSIALYCDAAEHRRRIVAEDRAGRGKLQDAAAVDKISMRPLIQRRASQSISLNITSMTADAAAAYLLDWLPLQI